ncbi:4-hydroxythreonine-4-phosphate dehydrogenase PdxA [Candidatus Desantisbacteria bacterium CG2_30_40_21]|uniref:4-hydroxythreonine-4-phosphate dehydrogenase n=4 Tax=unclassified Candidatus Desantisiibacteriota TaxID=3106372 RepID=A0A2M7JF58_9BACT|nr:MAG: 4-hydroxythreonine-4-phosphate dehydrogenase PdxA [Candidatus Desantisbacteria bacterium CG2_30_40_21]PIP40812.1 MAG: 4-hydroxythreonine-4-phosphate dehydrogenase PdxA [Candidatus Desantisbacteria bacterium CG23_combo_of_CG06-09_8_20_14_all_40_23]PIX18044.1 MAG: 4-hydroxythreonine-4-phosphate dehydrogenase PdxA [Candidatus Desantisbacteria bacterium CG_4_8_14_3_um_filter_40_12]PIY18597.1 MAG: 4-hydroxythreonine-4-phosphate dehydrogenase PdxA [Candidatus Desantisbacteria bacterium CG_4_10
MIIGITLGDVCGIGPEVVIKAVKLLQEEHPLLIIGDARAFKHFCAPWLDGWNILSVDSPSSARREPGVLNILDLKNINLDHIAQGKVCPEAGRAAVEYIKIAVGLAMDGKIAGIVTAPINKEAIHKAGFDYPGHTQLLAELTATTEYAMMFYSCKLKVILATIHVALRDVPEMITAERVLKIIQLADKSLQQDFGIQSPVIAVAGLNPHAGEDGAFGKEDMEIIKPAIDMAVCKGIKAAGPYPPDTVFLQAVNGKYDLVVAMYHDQGLIPLKLLAFDSAVNITVGLPIIRTSPDHGTAFDIAGKGVANPQSMIEAIRLAAMVAKRK